MTIGSQKSIPVEEEKRVPTILHEHEKIHDGELFFANYSKAANDAETLEIFIRAGGTRHLLHVTFKSSSLLTGTWALYKATSKTYNASNVIAPQNHFDGHPNTLHTDVQICHTPSGSGDGTRVAGGFCGGGSLPQSPGGVSRAEAELILYPKRAYLLRITSNANSNTLEGELGLYERFHHDAPVTTTTTTTTTSSSTTTTTA